MFRTSRLFLLAVTVAVGLHAPSLMAYSVAVGPASCLTALPHYPTIQSAVSSVPPFATVIVCPGTYPEQVVISQPTTLQGLVAGAEIITVPASGLVGNTTSSYYGTLAAQLLATNTSGVTVKDIIVDGTGSKCASGVTYVAGIVFYKIGVPADVNSGGTIQNMVVRNVYPSNCYGEGIWSDISYITIVGNDVHDLNNSGVYAAVGNNSIVSNNIAHLGFATYLDSASGTTISGNTSFGTYYGSVLLNGSSISLTKNSMVNSSYAIYVYAVSNGTITQNKISGSYQGMLMYGVKSTTVQGNIINNSGGPAIYVDDFGPGGNTIKGNTILEAPCGISQGSAVGDILSPNTLLGVVATTCP